MDDRFGFSTLLVDDVHGFFVLRFAHFYCNPFHADTGGTDADNQKKPRRRTTPGERIMTIGLRKDRLKNEPTTGNIRCGIIPHLIFRTAVGLANDMEGIISCTATARVGEGRSVIPQPGRGPWRSRCRRSWATGRNRWIGRSACSLLRWSHGESFSGNRSCCRATPGRGEHARSKREAGTPIKYQVPHYAAPDISSP